MRTGRAWWIVVAMVLAAGLWVSGAQAQQACKGTKQWYQGACRYPREIEAMKAAEARKRAEAEKARKEAKDREDCQSARGADTAAAWRTYLEQHPAGTCQSEASARIAALEAPAEPSTEPPAEPSADEPSAPAAEQPEPPVPADGPDEGSGGISPLAWVGFGVGAAGLITFAVAGGIASSRASELKDSCPDNRCSAEKQGELDDANLSADVATAGAVVAGVGTAFGLVALFAFDGGGDAEAAGDEPAPEAGLRPLVGLGTVGVEGWF